MWWRPLPHTEHNRAYRRQTGYNYPRRLRPRAAQGGLSIVYSAIPRLVESHVIARLNLYSPGIFRIFRWTWDQAEGHTIAFDLERLYLDPPVLDRTEFCQTLFEALPVAISV